MGVLTGKYNDKVFNGLVKGWMQVRDRKDNDKGTQNLKFTLEYESFCHGLSIDSPMAYRNFRNFFPAPTLRSIKRVEAREERFPLNICDHTFELVADHLKKIEYTGTAGLSCDDSKAQKALRLMFDKKKDKWFLVGSTDGPKQVIDPKNVIGILKETMGKAATKVCIAIQQVFRQL